MRVIWACFLLVVAGWSKRAVAGYTAHREIAMKLDNISAYDRSNRPGMGGPPVVVSLDVVFISVGPVHEMDMTWSASFYLRQEWTDPRMILPGSDTSTSVKLDGDTVSKIWVPDLFFSNSKQGRKHDLTVENHLVFINVSTGRMLYSQRLSMVMSCEMDLLKFPHDSQSCDMSMESYSFTTDDLVLKWSSSRSATTVLPTAYIPDFNITDMEPDDCTATYAIGTFPCLRIIIYLERMIGFYIFQTYLPSILIVILSWASFWIDHEAVPARISVGLLTVLTITTQLSGSRAQLPRVPYIKAIDVWMSTNLVFVFAAYMEYAVVTVLSRKYKKKRIRKAKKEMLSLARFNKDASEAGPELNGDAETGQADEVNTRQPKKWPFIFRLCTFEGKTDYGRTVDKRARFLFTAAYTVFNIVYWVYYSFT